MTASPTTFFVALCLILVVALLLPTTDAKGFRGMSSPTTTRRRGLNEGMGGMNGGMGGMDGKMGGNAALLLGVKVTAFKIYYAYDVSFLDFQQYNGGGHEVTIAFDFKGGSGARARRRRF